MPAVERSSLVLPVGRFVLEASLRLLAGLPRDGAGHVVGLSVNVSPKELASPEFAATALGLLDRSGVPPAAIVVEIVETGPSSDDRTAISQLIRLREAGVAVAIDDFGAGHSNLLRLLDMPVDQLKLDRSIVSRLPGDGRAVAAVRSTLTLAHDLGMEVVAEGVESEAQRDHLVELGCRRAQGFLFGRAMDPGELEAYLVAVRGREPAGPDRGSGRGGSGSAPPDGGSHRRPSPGTGAVAGGGPGRSPANN